MCVGVTKSPSCPAKIGKSRNNQLRAFSSRELRDNRHGNSTSLILLHFAAAAWRSGHGPGVQGADRRTWEPGLPDRPMCRWSTRAPQKHARMIPGEITAGKPQRFKAASAGPRQHHATSGVESVHRAARLLHPLVGRLRVTPRPPPRSPQERSPSNGLGSAASPALVNCRTRDRCSSRTEDRAPEAKTRAAAVLGVPSPAEPTAQRYEGGISMFGCRASRSAIRRMPEYTEVVCSTFERSADRPPLEPEDINLLDGSQRRLVVVEGKSLQRRRVVPSPFCDHRRAVGARNPICIPMRAPISARRVWIWIDPRTSVCGALS